MRACLNIVNSMHSLHRFWFVYTDNYSTFENRPKVPPLPQNFDSLSVDEKEAIEYAGVKIRARNVGNVKFIGTALLL